MTLNKAVAVASVWLALGGLALAQASNSPTAQSLLGSWTDTLHVFARVAIVAFSALGILFALVSLVQAYNTDDRDTNKRSRHVIGAFFGGIVTITGVIAGWASNLFMPG